MKEIHEIISTGLNVWIRTIYCPYCGKRWAIEIPDKMHTPSTVTIPCGCGRELSVKLDQNDFTVTVPYDKR